MEQLAAHPVSRRLFIFRFLFEGPSMRRKLLVLCAPILLSVGCSFCGSGCYDYLPPVADGPYCSGGGRAGSAFGDYAKAHGNLDGPLPDPAAEIASENADSQQR